MTVFKAYIKIIKASLPTIIMYFSIFMIVTFIVGSVGTSNSSFQVSNPRVVIINNDDSKLTSEFVKYVKSNAVVVNIVDEQLLKDALFYREVDFILEIPKNYGQDFVNNKNVKIKTMSIDDSSSNAYAEMLLNKYFETYKTYLSTGMDEDNIIKLIHRDLAIRSNVKMLDNNKKDIDKVNYFFNYTNYTILAVCILVIGLVINTFNNQKISKRNAISATSIKSINRQLFLGNMCLTFTVWFLYVVMSFILYKDTMWSINGLLFAINSFVFSVMALSLGMCVGGLVKNKEAQSGIVNIISLGSSFICGAFVPQEYLGSSVLMFAKFLPSYWYINANNKISMLSAINWTNTIPIIFSILIILIFAILLFIITNIINKSKLKDR